MVWTKYHRRRDRVRRCCHRIRLNVVESLTFLPDRRYKSSQMHRLGVSVAVDCQIIGSSIQMYP